MIRGSERGSQRLFTRYMRLFIRTKHTQSFRCGTEEGNESEQEDHVRLHAHCQVVAVLFHIHPPSMMMMISMMAKTMGLNLNARWRGDCEYAMTLAENFSSAAYASAIDMKRFNYLFKQFEFYPPNCSDGRPTDL